MKTKKVINKKSKEKRLWERLNKSNMTPRQIYDYVTKYYK